MRSLHNPMRDSFSGGNALANPAHHRHSHAVSERPVALAIGRYLAGVTAALIKKRNGRVIVWEPLKPLALGRRQAADAGIRNRLRLLIDAPPRTAIGAQGLNDLRRTIRPGREGADLVARRESAVISGDPIGARDQRNSAARTILAGIKALSPEGMSNKGLSLKILTAPVRRQGSGNPKRTRCISATETDQGYVVSAMSAVFASAASKGAGNVFFRFSARWMIPEQAFALKKYRCGTSPVSKISNKEDAAATLGDSKVLSVQHSVGEPIPEFRQTSEDGSKIPSSVRGQNARDVFPNQPAGAEPASKAQKFDGQVTTVVIQAASEACNAERLTRGAANEKIDSCVNAESPKMARADRREIAPQRRAKAAAVTAGILCPLPMLQHAAWKLLNFGQQHGLPAKALPRDRGGFDARADRDEFEPAPHRSALPAPRLARRRVPLPFGLGEVRKPIPCPSLRAVQVNRLPRDIGFVSDLAGGLIAHRSAPHHRREPGARAHRAALSGGAGIGGKKSACDRGMPRTLAASISAGISLAGMVPPVPPDSFGRFQFETRVRCRPVIFETAVTPPRREMIVDAGSMCRIVAIMATADKRKRSDYGPFLMQRKTLQSIHVD